MRKIINLILGALIAVLAGCKTQQQSVKQENRAVMYGPPAYFQQQAQPNDTTQNNIEQTQNS